MNGPQYQKIAEIEHRFTSKQMLTRLQDKMENPLTKIIERLKHEFSQYDTAYSDEIIDHHISSVDRILSFDSKLGPILSGLQKENVVLRKELSIMQGQLSNTVSICEQILNQNNELKVIVKRKNEDISKVISTIANHESEARSELNDKNMLLQQENSILIQHLQQVTKEHAHYTQLFQAKDQDIATWKNNSHQHQKHLNQAINQERDLSRKIAFIEQNLYQQTQANYDLQQINQNLKFENNQFKNQLLLTQGKATTQDIDQAQKKIKEDYQVIFEEHRLLKKERGQFLRESEKLKMENQKLESQLIELQRKYNKAMNDFELTCSLLNQQKSQTAGINSTKNKLDSKVNELREENHRLRVENEASNEYGVNREKMLQREIEEVRRSMDEKSQQMEQRLKEIREKTKAMLDAKEIDMQSLSDTNLQLRRALDRAEKR